MWRVWARRGEVAAGLLDAVDLGILGENLVGLGSEGHAGTAGYVVEDDGQFHPVGDVLIVLDQTGLGYTYYNRE